MELSKEESERRQNRERKGRKVTGKQAQRRNGKKTIGGGEKTLLGERERNTYWGKRGKGLWGRDKNLCPGMEGLIIRGRRKIRWGLGEKKPVGLGGARWRSVEVGGFSGAGGARWGSVGPVEVGGGR